MAASKVNTRFVWGLVAALVVIFAGAAGLLWVVKSQQAQRNVARGDRKMAEGDYEAAEKFYSQAVNKQQQNIEWLTKWRDAMMHKRPDKEERYRSDFEWLTRIHRALAVAGKTDVAAHRAYLDMILQQAEAEGSSREVWDMLIAETETALRYFDERDTGGWPILRRYRGLARTSLAGFLREVTEEQGVQAREDLRTALALEPGDGACATAYLYWCIRDADAAKLRRDAAGEQAALERGREVGAKAAGASPRDPRSVLAPIRFESDAVVRGIDATRPAAEIVAARRARLASLKPRLDEADAALRGADPALIDHARAVEFLSISEVIDPGSGFDRCLRLIDTVLAVRPDAASLLFLKGRMFAERKQHEEAIAEFQKIVDMNVPPVSFAGVLLLGLQKQAVFSQANSALILAAALQGAERAAADARAEGFRAALAARLPDHAPELMFLDAKRAMSRGDLTTAQDLLSEYSRVTADLTFEAFEALFLNGQVAMQQGKPGLAVDLFTRAMDRRPDAVVARLALGNAQMELQRYGDALRTYQSVLDGDPGNDAARERVEMLRAIVENPETLTDPIRRALAEAERLSSGKPKPPRDPDGAIRVLEKAIAEHGADPRLAVFLAGLRIANGDAPGAREAVRAGLARTPDDSRLKSIQAQLDAGESLDAALKLVDETAKTDVDRFAGRYIVYRQFGHPEQAAEALRQAAAAAPDDARVVEWQFLEALDRKDLAAAGALADRAKALNCDGADGLTFRARVLIARNELAPAAQTLEQAVARSPTNVALLRLLGNVRLSLGRGVEAIESYQAALRVNPGDRETIKSYVAALARLGRSDEALRAARDAEQFVRNDPEFLHMLFGLEAAVGNRAAALAGRERLRAVNPRDARNGAALVGLYLGNRDWAKARTLIDELRAAGDSLELVTLDAAWYADQGDMQGANAAFIGYMDTLVRAAAEPMTAAPYLAFGEFLLNRGQADLGLNAFRKAAEYQSSRREADTAYANALYGLARWDEAVVAFDAALAAGAPDPDRVIATRTIEALLMRGKPEEAASRLDALAGAVNEDVVLSVLRAAVQERRGDKRAARETLNRAVERFPNHQLPYYRRALLNAAEPAFRDDAMADLEQALRLAPGFWEARVARANINLIRDRVDEAMTDLGAAVEANPDHDELRYRQIAELIRRGREAEAFESAQAGLRRRPNDAGLAIGLGDLFAREQLHARAAELYRNAWASFKSGQAAALYAEALLRSTPPNLREAEAVLTSAGLPVEATPTLLMLRASLRALQGQGPRAESDAIAAYNLADADPGSLGGWHERFVGVFADPATRSRILEGLPARGPAAPWLEFFRACSALGLPGRRTGAIDELKRLGGAASADPVLAGYIYRALEAALRDDKNWEDAADACMKGAAACPNDYVLHNNAAAILVEYLKRPEVALPYATKAAELSPGRVEVHDTLGSVYAALKKPAEAEQAYRTALTVAYRPGEKAKALLPLVRMRVEAGDAAGAREFAGQIRRLLAADATLLNDDQKRELTELENRAR